MKNADAILQFVLRRIADVYERPLMYGGTPECVGSLLHYYHELVAEILERRQDLEDVRQRHREELRSNGMDFAALYRSRQADAPDQEVARFVVENWREIDSRLGVQL